MQLPVHRFSAHGFEPACSIRDPALGSSGSQHDVHPSSDGLWHAVSFHDDGSGITGTGPASSAATVTANVTANESRSVACIAAPDRLQRPS